MLFLFLILLFSYSFPQVEKGESQYINHNFDSVQNYPKTISDFIAQNMSSDYKLINITGTSYFNPFHIDLNQYSERNILIKSISGTQYVYLTGIQSIEHKALFSESVFINIEQPILTISRLSLVQSPIFCPNEPISIFVDFLSSDYLSIPLNYVKSVKVSKHFYIIEDSLTGDHFHKAPHAQIILENSAGYSIFQENDRLPKVLENTDDVEDPNISNSITGIYVLNSSLRRLMIYDKYISAVFVDSSDEMNLTTNSSNQIMIETDSRRIDIEHFGGSMYPIMQFELYFKEESILVFGPSFDLIQNDRIIQNIVISHDNLITLTSATSVPYVTAIPVSYVIYIPARQITENYCLCLKSSFENCVRNEECLVNRVPLSNYFFGTNSSFTSEIARSKSDIINIYVTYTNPNSNEYHTVEIKPSQRSGKTYNFISSNKDLYTSLRIQSSALDQTSAISISFTDISNLLFRGVSGTVAKLTLKNSSITIGQSISIPELVTDLASLSVEQPNSITVTSLFQISKGVELNEIGIGLIMAPKSFLQILQISLFTQMRIGVGTIGFSDGSNEFSILIQDNGPVGIAFEEPSPKLNPLVEIICSGSSSSLELNIQILLTSAITLSFVNSNPMPEKVRFEFLPADIVTTLSLLLPPDPPHFPAEQHLYNFNNLTGNIDLILLTPDTVSSFFSAILRQDFYTDNLSKLTLNMIDSFESVTLYEDAFTINLSSSIQITINTTFVAGQLTLMTNKTDLITLALGSEDMTFFPPFALDAVGNMATIFFDNSFEHHHISDSSMFSSILINHHKYNVTLMTDMETVPMVTVDDSIAGVLYEAKKTNFVIPSDQTNFRSGPNLVVDISDREMSANSFPRFIQEPITVDQSDFLAETVTFQGYEFTFIAHSKSRVNYSFLNTSVYFNLTYSDQISTFDAYALNFENSTISSEQYSRISTNYLTSDIASLTTNSISILDVTDRTIINDEFLGGMIIDNDLIEFYCGDALLTSTQVKSNLFIINYGGQQQINLSMLDTTLNTRIILNLIGDAEKTIFFDKSWYPIENIENFIIVVNANASKQLTIDVQLMEMPGITVIDHEGNLITDYKLVLYKPVFTKELSCYIFCAMFVFILIISVVLIIVGQCKAKSKNHQSKSAFAQPEITRNFITEPNTRYDTEPPNDDQVPK